MHSSGHGCRAHEWDPSFQVANAWNASKVILVRLAPHANFTPDLVLALRAIIIEGQEAHYHVFLFVEVNTLFDIQILIHSAGVPCFTGIPHLLPQAHCKNASS